MAKSLLITLLLFASAAVANDWPQFRGPQADGIANSAGVPITWDESTNIAWSVDVPGEGWSAPIVVGDRVLVTTTVPTEAGSRDRQFEVRCYGLATGEELWSQVARTAAPTEPTHRDNTWASETPVSDGKNVYAYFGMNGVYCYTLAGDAVWQTDPGAYPMQNGWGTSSAPVLAGDKLVLQIDNEDNPFVVALRTSDSKEAWRADRPDEVSNWSTPLVWKNSVRMEVVLGGKTVRSYDPATGEELWSMEIGGRSSATPTAIGDVLYIGSEDRTRRGGTPGGLFAVAAGASGSIDVTDPGAEGLAWANLRGAIGIASPLVFGGQIYVPERRGGVVRTHDAATGEQTSRQRLPTGTIWSSPLAIDGRVFLFDEQGKTLVLAPGVEAEILQTNQLPGRFWSTPAVTQGALIIRSQEKLFCIRADEGA